MKVSSRPLTPWVGRVAGHIGDPIARLRFLKAVAPIHSAEKPARRTRRWLLAVLAVLLALVFGISIAWMRMRAAVPRKVVPTVPSTAPAAAKPAATPDVWMVERNGEEETYSNGLRIDNHFRTVTHRRSYLAFPAAGGPPVARNEIAGIVFHTTESRQAPFEARDNRMLIRLGESLLEYVRRIQAYNFVVDRFGRIYRVVSETDAANHSGYSAWADDQWFYINLNEGFLGVAFEAISPVSPGAGDLSPAQVRSAATLVEWLRSVYRIPAANCVTHAQVSVNPSNMLVGMHQDWASGFPYEGLGLPDNYIQALPAVWAYGFDCDAEFRSKVGDRMQAGIEAARALLIRNAADAGISPAQYRKRLRQHYREMKAAVQHQRPA